MLSALGMKTPSGFDLKTNVSSKTNKVSVWVIVRIHCAKFWRDQQKNYNRLRTIMQRSWYELRRTAYEVAIFIVFDSKRTHFAPYIETVFIVGIFRALRASVMDFQTLRSLDSNEHNHVALSCG